jgi:SAM-dependent methyltransferase
VDEDGFFGEAVAARYDETSSEMFAPEVLGPCVDFIAEHARGGRALEFGIGTGRLALPLAARGIEVHGIDLSRAMVERLRAKPGGDAIGVTIGDYATASAPGTYRVAFVCWNGIQNLTTQDAQVACFANAARHLEPGGRFIVEVGLPDLQRLPPGERFRPFRVDADRLGFDEYDVASQGLVSHHVFFDGATSRRVSMPFRYVWPSELDLMARLAGLRPLERWSGWRREPFTSDSRDLVAVWETAPAAT